MKHPEPHHYDVITVGGGHAGCEAAAAAARMGARSLLLTHRIDTIGALSCNPSIGGLGKGHLVCEIDAMGGLMGFIADRSAIHFKVLNKSKGTAVQGPRAQIDRSFYKKHMLHALKTQKHLTIMEGDVQDLIIEQGRCAGVLVKTLEQRKRLYSHAVILTTGTFLQGEIHIGQQTTPGGRLHEKPSTKLALTLKARHFPLKRLKTGTPPRLKASSINPHAMNTQNGDEQPRFFSILSDKAQNPHMPCFITETNPSTHEKIRNALRFSPLPYGRKDVNAPGPRYCPSLEEKVIRFHTRQHHTLFIEPEGIDSDVVYPNGLSMSLPETHQRDIIHSIKGLEKAHVTAFGYCIEYSCVDARSITHQLESRLLPHLYLAGQINGTTGYEEAAAQGLVAGIHAVLKQRGQKTLPIDRANSYIGVMIDDLTRYPLHEPYRMLTSRAEYRLRLRTDNATERLTAIAIDAHCINVPHKRQFEQRKKQLHDINRLIKPHQETLAKQARQHVLTVDAMRQTLPALSAFSDALLEKYIADWRYAPYVERQDADIAAMRYDDALPLPPHMDYTSLGALSTECIEALEQAKPTTLGSASRLPGITPAAVIALLRHAKKIARHPDP
ncbi:MAG: tRNA uridine-5-carboxymethylaminomethyl(34) synthesis enzyme MnmG [Alphaproteobacteria bacterium GM7ARS4]|nr:tRNA uridine-5-carboxymethylaminomethyl(34) synthesis enzyme MnmG [Alphaproteobacteria bacterium GM7ARS4]